MATRSVTCTNCAVSNEIAEPVDAGWEKSAEVVGTKVVTRRFSDDGGPEQEATVAVDDVRVTSRRITWLCTNCAVSNVLEEQL